MFPHLVEVGVGGDRGPAGGLSHQVLPVVFGGIAERHYGPEPRGNRRRLRCCLGLQSDFERQSESEGRETEAFGTTRADKRPCLHPQGNQKRLTYATGLSGRGVIRLVQPAESPTLPMAEDAPVRSESPFEPGRMETLQPGSLFDGLLKEEM